MRKSMSSSMCKHNVSDDEKDSKSNWQLALEESEKRLEEARRRVKELESARDVFLRKVSEGAAWPEPATRS